jgi:hypothetical protein
VLKKGRGYNEAQASRQSCIMSSTISGVNHHGQMNTSAISFDSRISMNEEQSGGGQKSMSLNKEASEHGESSRSSTAGMGKSRHAEELEEEADEDEQQEEEEEEEGEDEVEEVDETEEEEGEEVDQDDDVEEEDEEYEEDNEHEEMEHSDVVIGKRNAVVEINFIILLNKSSLVVDNYSNACD